MSLFPKYNSTAAKPAKSAKPSPTLATLATLATMQKDDGETLRSNNQMTVEQLPQWQHDLCIAHADFNNWRGQCPVILDDCLISKVIESNGNLDKLRGLNLGHGITTDAVIDPWLATGEPAKDLINDPVWFVCMAEHLVTGHVV
ncbi:hypothetical protein [Pelovirga terrestris]|uniref:Uncharacterized protein n=1 Tax=Pelovirga terrestris TaxID=2771352 RepID=A0A8J6UQP6_9BACT|nr:hypothetical protein [Pelovirga terrestris]MBD1399436.1 hypothetical protein [Pelovirga terrestris]